MALAGPQYDYARTFSSSGAVHVAQVGAEQEKFATDAARADDKIAADVYAKAGAKVWDLDDATVKKWQAIARDTAWKDYAERSDSCKALLAAAQKLKIAHV